MLYCAATIVTENCGFSVPWNTNTPCYTQPAWKRHLSSTIQHLNADLSRLISFKKSQLHRRDTISRLFQQYNIHSDSDVDRTCEYLRQRISANTCRLKRYEAKWRTKKQNDMFKHQKHTFFQSLTSEEKNVIVPPVNDTLTFWKQLWENPRQHDSSFLTHIRAAMNPIDPMTPPVITDDLFIYAISRIKNWKSPGPDGLHGFWIKQFKSLHSRLCTYLNDILCGRLSVDAWLLEG